MPVNAETWTVADIITRITKDLDLQGDSNFYRQDHLILAINSAITDCEQIVIDEYSDYLLSYQDYTTSEGQSELTLPDDMYQFRIRWLHFKKTGFGTYSENNFSYKIKKIALESLPYVGVNTRYHYRVVNTQASGQQILIFPNIRAVDAGSARIRLWYIRHFQRVSESTDTIDVPLPEYILAHVRKAVMQKEGHPLLNVAAAELAQQKANVIKTMKFLTDDEEDEKLEPNHESLDTMVDETYYVG